ncbi:DUF5592 family protein [uncultured Limosilactobacillus sp.]|uniref:DUF5592 family protein n=1 Tax=uncultured Limosilactobacillus sp. TaxID=2837629 RepID=UPI0025F7796C|nr:DUF5592 family protein [uncultured Limosilactobacillus sp.]
MNDFGVVPDIHAEIKLNAFMYLKDVGVFAIVLGLTFVLDQIFPAEQTKQSFIFLGLGLMLTIYMDLRPSSNPGKRNYEIIWMLIMNRHPKEYKSYGYYEFKSVPEMRKEDLLNGN